MQMNEKKYFVFFWLLYSLITLVGVWNHEPNRDEAQVWLLVRDLNLSKIFSHINTEGHPCMWYLIVLPFAKLGLPYFSMQLIHWLIAVVATGLFLFRAPLNKLLKVLFVFSYLMLYQYSVVARNYGIVILFLFLIATYYKSRFTKPYLFALLIVALYNCHVLAFGGAFALSFIYFLEAKRNKQLNTLKFPLLIMLGGMVSVIIQLFPYSHATANALIHTNYIPQLNINTWWIALTSIQNAFVPVDSEYEELKVALFFAIVLVLFIVSAIRKLSVFIFLLFTYSWILYVFTTVHSGSLKHQGLILVFIIFTLWISSFYTNKENKLSKLIAKFINLEYLGKSVLMVVVISLFIGLIYGFSFIKKEYLYEYSGSKTMAKYIIQNNLESTEIACYRSWRATAVAPYLPNTKFWFIDRKEFGTYFILDSTFTKDGNTLSEYEIIKRAKEKYNKKALLLLNYPLSIQADSTFEYHLLYENEKLRWGTDDENFLLYEINFNKK